jgi:hypothetical protein
MGPALFAQSPHQEAPKQLHCIYWIPTSEIEGNYLMDVKILGLGLAINDVRLICRLTNMRRLMDQS